jgi:short-subunit dehydrogenase
MGMGELRDRVVVVTGGSALSDRSIPLQSAYCGAKHGIRGFTDSIRSELIHDCSRVHITMVLLQTLIVREYERHGLSHVFLIR